MASSKKLQQDLFDALIDAYPRREFLAEMLSHELDWRLEHFSGSTDNLRQSIQATMREAYENGRTVELIQAAQADNPGNPLLREIDATEYASRRYRWAEVHEPTDYLARRRRDYLLAAETLWITMRLNESLEEKIWLELGIEEVPEVTASYDARYDHVRDGITIQVDSEQPLAETFHQNGRSLLILGEPGSGKTTILLKLAEQLFKEAIEDIHSQIPIILNLSSWAIEQKRLEDWIGDELAKLGLMPDREVTKTWLQNRQVVLMLDALDEVAEAHQGDCLAEINELRAKGIDLVVSCRDKEFAELGDLNISYAVRIENFEKDEIVQHLEEYKSRELSGVIEAVNNEDGEWADLLKVPLTLTLAAMALDGVSAEQLTSEGSEKDAKRLLFKQYTTQMLMKWPIRTNNYGVRKALVWLHNLGRGMNQHELTRFYIEWLQPTWLERQQKRGDSILNRLIESFRTGLLLVVLYSLIGGIVVGVGSWMADGLIYGLKGVLYGGMILGLFGFMLGGIADGLSAFSPKKIFLQEYVRWNWIELKHWSVIINMQTNLLVGLMGGLLVGLIGWLNSGLSNGVRLGISSLLSIGLGLGTLNLYVAIQRPSRMAIILRKIPGHGVLQSIKNAVIFGVIVGLSFGLISGLSFGLISGLNIGIRVGLGIGLIVGLFLGLVRGQDILAHYILRYELMRFEILPGFWTKTIFLFYVSMVDRVFLRQIGGGWEFVHRYLLDYFASLTNEEIDEIAHEVDRVTKPA